MQAKKYHFPYETIRALTTVRNRTQESVIDYICIQGKDYPIYNIDLLIDTLRAMKQRMSLELDKSKKEKCSKNEEVQAIIGPILKETFKDLGIKIIVESGYKEYFSYGGETGAYGFDLTKLKKVNHFVHIAFDVEMLSYGDLTINLSEWYPEYFKGKWHLVENSL